MIIYDRPLQLLPSLAVTIGLNEALFVQRLHELLQQGYTIINGKRLVRISYEELQEDHFPFFSISTIKRIIKNLIEYNLVACEKYEGKNGKLLKFYTINYDKFTQLEIACTMLYIDTDKEVFV